MSALSLLASDRMSHSCPAPGGSPRHPPPRGADRVLANPGLHLPSSPHVLLSLLDRDHTEMGPRRLHVCTPTLGTQCIPVNPSRMNPRETVQFSPLFPRCICGTSASLRPANRGQNKCLLALATFFSRPDAYGCPSAMCHLKESGHSGTIFVFFNFNCIDTLVSLIPPFPRTS